MSDCISIRFVYVTMDDGDKARVLARELVERRLAACVNLLPIGSVYRWEGRLVEDAEVALIAKTTAERYAGLEAFVREFAGYVNCVAALPVSAVRADYAGWLAGEVSA